MNAYNLRTLQMILLVALIGVACTPTGVEVPPLPTLPAGNAVNLPPTSAPPTSGAPIAAPPTPGPCKFSATGNSINGWSWLRDEAYTAYGLWDCRGLATDRDLTVHLWALVTNKADGGSGYSSPVKVTYLNPTNQISQTVQFICRLRSRSNHRRTVRVVVIRRWAIWSYRAPPWVRMAR